MTTPSLFQSLSKEEKIEFFVKCQSLLVAHHPDSEFILTKENWRDRIGFARNFIERYKGYCYADDNICVLFNKVKIIDPKDPIKALKDHIYQEPAIDFNAYSIDFVVFKKLADCLGFCLAQYSPQIVYVLFVKNNEVKLYEAARLLDKLNAPLVAFV